MPVWVIGHPEAAGEGQSPTTWLDGEWSEPREIANVQVLIGRVGAPRRLQAFFHDEDVAITLVGYDTEREITSTVSSLRRVAGG